MVRLEQISTMDYVQNYLSRSDQDLFLKAGIVDYQKLEDFIRKNPEWKFSKTADHLFMVKERVLVQDDEFEGTIYQIPEYSDDSLAYNDSLVFGSSLILNSPSSTNRLFTANLEKMTMAEIKHRLTHLNVYFKNFFEVYSTMSPAKARKVLSALYLYNEQIERQALETSRRDINLFTYMYEEKRKIIEKEIIDIIAWFLQNTKEAFIWGDLSETQKKKYLSAMVRDFTPDIYLKENLIDVITNYVSMSEVEEGLTKGDTLKRFVIK